VSLRLSLRRTSKSSLWNRLLGLPSLCVHRRRALTLYAAIDLSWIDDDIYAKPAVPIGLARVLQAKSWLLIRKLYKIGGNTDRGTIHIPTGFLLFRCSSNRDFPCLSGHPPLVRLGVVWSRLHLLHIPFDPSPRVVVLPFTFCFLS